MTLNVGVIGCGAISELHFRGIQLQCGCRIVACCDVNKNAAEQRAREFDVANVFENDSDLLSHPSLDLVAICTPPKWHCELVLRALDRGLNVLVEKPLSKTLAEADQLVAVTEASNCIVGV